MSRKGLIKGLLLTCFLYALPAVPPENDIHPDVIHAPVKAFKVLAGFTADLSSRLFQRTTSPDDRIVPADFPF